MRISTKGRYALRLFIDLAEHRGDGYSALKDIAERQGVSKKYLEQIIPLFNNTDMLRANRGSQGGYMLAKAPDQYTVYDIVSMTEGSLAPVHCVEGEDADCDRIESCEAFFVWQGLYKTVGDYLKGITLQDILDNKRERGTYDYVI